MATKEKKSPEHTCEGIVYPKDRYGSFHGYKHGKSARCFEDGKWYCKIHAPSEIKKKDSIRKAKWDAEWDAQKQVVKNEKDSTAAALETHARERRLLRTLAGYEGTGRKQVTMNHRGSPEGQAGFEVMFWCNPETEDIFFVLADSEGVPIISDELNAALMEALGEGAKP